MTEPVTLLLALAWLLPWINPLSDGPSPSVLPALVTAASTGLALLLVRPRTLATPVLLFLLALGAVLTWSSPGWSPELALSGLGLLVLAASAAIGAELRTGPGLPAASALRALVGALLLAALLSCAMALVQYLGWASSFYPWVNQSPDGTAYANLRQRNQLATLTSLGMMALVWLLQSGQTAPGAAGRAPAVPAVSGAWQLSRHAPWMMALLVLVNAITASRTGMVQIALLALLAWCWRGQMDRRARRLLWMALPVYCLAAWLMPWLKGAVLGNAFARIVAHDPGCASRSVLWSNVVDLIRQQPLSGWGWRELAWAHYQGHFEARFCQILDNAHNLPLHMAVELGVPAALAVSAVLCWALWRGQPWREADPTRQLAWGVLLAIAVHSLVEYPLWYGPFQMVAGLCTGWLLRPVARHAERGDTTPAVVASTWCLVAVLLLAGTVWAWRDYYRVSQIYLPRSQRAPAFRDDTLARIGDSWLFGNQLQFAQLSMTPLTIANAAAQRALAQRLLHYSPEPRVIEVLVETASLAGDTGAAVAELQRYRAAFPQDYAQWRSRNQASVQAYP